MLHEKFNFLLFSICSLLLNASCVSQLVNGARILAARLAQFISTAGSPASPSGCPACSHLPVTPVNSPTAALLKHISPFKFTLHACTQCMFTKATVLKFIYFLFPNT